MTPYSHMVQQKTYYTLARDIIATFAVSVTTQTADSSCLLACTGAKLLMHHFIVVQRIVTNIYLKLW
jgi:hypothetical protein